MSKPLARIRIYDEFTKSLSYIVVQDSEVSYFGGSLIPYCLSNLVGNRAAELRFRLEDAQTADEALQICREIINDSYDIQLLTREEKKVPQADAMRALRVLFETMMAHDAEIDGVRGATAKDYVRLLDWVLDAAKTVGLYKEAGQ